MATKTKRKINSKLILILVLAVAITSIVPLSSMASGGAKAEVRFKVDDEIYSEKTVEITENSNEENGVHHFDSSSYPDDPDKEGMTFIGWDYEGKTYTKDSDEQFNIAAGNPIVLTAQFKKNQSSDDIGKDEDSNAGDDIIDPSVDNNEDIGINEITDPSTEEELGGPDTSYPDDDDISGNKDNDPGNVNTDANTAEDAGEDDGYVIADNETAEEIIANGQVPSTSIGNSQVPYYSGGLFGSWSVINLILVVAGALIALYTILKLALTRRSEDGERLEANDETAKSRKKKLTWMIATAIFAIGGIAIFILTQDTSATMVLVDMWTIVNTFLFAASIVSAVFVLKKDKKEDSVDITIES